MLKKIKILVVFNKYLVLRLYFIKGFNENISRLK